MLLPWIHTLRTTALEEDEDRSSTTTMSVSVILRRTLTSRPGLFWGGVARGDGCFHGFVWDGPCEGSGVKSTSSISKEE